MLLLRATMIAATTRRRRRSVGMRDWIGGEERQVKPGGLMRTKNSIDKYIIFSHKKNI